MELGIIKRKMVSMEAFWILIWWKLIFSVARCNCIGSSMFLDTPYWQEHERPILYIQVRLFNPSLNKSIIVPFSKSSFKYLILISTGNFMYPCFGYIKCVKQCWPLSGSSILRYEYKRMVRKWDSLWDVHVTKPKGKRLFVLTQIGRGHWVLWLRHQIHTASHCQTVSAESAQSSPTHSGYRLTGCRLSEGILLFCAFFFFFCIQFHFHWN